MPMTIRTSFSTKDQTSAGYPACGPQNSGNWNTFRITSLWAARRYNGYGFYLAADQKQGNYFGDNDYNDNRNQKRDLMGNIFIGRENGTEAYYLLPRFKRPSDTPMMADTVQRDSAGNLLSPRVMWAGGNLLENGAIHLIHNGQANVGYPDGHAASLNDGGLWESAQKVRVVYLQDGTPRQRL